MTIIDIAITPDEFNQVDIESVISQLSERNCDYYSSPFFAKSEEAKSNGLLIASAVFRLLGALTDFHLMRLDIPEQPYVAKYEGSTGRTAMPEDFTEEELALLAQTAKDIQDADLRARTADVIWLRKKDFRMAGLAVESYLESGTLLEHPEDWSQSADRIERALQLALKINSKPLVDKVISHIENVLAKYDGQDPSFLTIKMFELLTKNNKVAPVKYIPLVERYAKENENQKDWRRARHFWDILEQLYRKEKNSEKAKEASINSAETHFNEGLESLNIVPSEADSSERNYPVAIFHLQQAYEAYTKIPNAKSRQDEIHKKILEYQEKSVEGLPRISTDPIDITDFVENAQNFVRGKPLFEALLALATASKSESKNALRQQVLDLSEQAPLLHIITTTIINEKGKTVAKAPGILSNDPEEVEAAITANMYRNSIYNRSLKVASTIDPMRYQIDLEHNVRIQDFYPIVFNNPLIPPGREQLYAKGLYEGLIGDFLTAAHILIPQLENSIRYLLYRTGKITSTFENEGIQNEYDINKTLRMSELTEILGEDIVFELRGLLTEHAGSNLRNLFAHGLLDYERFFNTEVEYVWWLTLRLLFIPIIHKLQEVQNATEEQQAE
ncbi:DUF4209 domain-containing protein [Candidatus Chlorohelix sp.]|uniref:DUF4209 domain-containing protein n=1 Tax=Candidatus Chlorohelix sp. TaxID=3139201 RepID=UPI00304CFB07